MTTSTTSRRWRGSSCGNRRKKSLDMNQRKSGAAAGFRPNSASSVMKSGQLV
jgi:hypothetical protein